MVSLGELIFDKTVEYMTPSISSLILQAIDDLQSEQNPPYSRGCFLIMIRRRFISYKLSHKFLYRDVFEPIFTSLAKLSQFYCDKEFCRFSMRRIDDNFLTFGEIIGKRFPGYVLQDQGIIVNVSDITIDLDELLPLLRSKDIAKY